MKRAADVGVGCGETKVCPWSGVSKGDSRTGVDDPPHPTSRMLQAETNTTDTNIRFMAAIFFISSPRYSIGWIRGNITQIHRPMRRIWCILQDDQSLVKYKK